jgi:hypothetical protein
MRARALEHIRNSASIPHLRADAQGSDEGSKRAPRLTEYCEAALSVG